MLIPDCELAYVYLGKLSKKGYLLIHNINFYIDEFKELAYKFRITTKNQFEQDKMGFLKSRIACSTEFICNFAKVCYFLGCFFMFSWAKN